MNIDWSKAPADATHGRITTADVDFYKRSSSGEWVYMNAQDKWEIAYLANESNCEERPKAATWTGEGLPPIGAVCEWRDDDSGGWQVVELMYLSKVTALLRFPNVPGDCEGAYSPGDCQFRPFRTPEQVAAGQREKSVKEMQAVVKSAELGYMNGLYALYDAGYRKP